MSRKLLTAEQLAKELKVSVETIDGWGRSGKIPRIRISHKIIRFDRDAVLSALSQAGDKADER
jgi:excisionase family DNA binding protein